MYIYIYIYKPYYTVQDYTMLYYTTLYYIIYYYINNGKPPCLWSPFLLDPPRQTRHGHSLRMQGGSWNNFGSKG